MAANTLSSEKILGHQTQERQEHDFLSSHVAYNVVLITPAKSHLQFWAVRDGLSCREGTEGHRGDLATSSAVLQLLGYREKPSYLKEKHSARPKTTFQPTSICQDPGKGKKKKEVCLLHAV